MTSGTKLTIIFFKMRLRFKNSRFKKFCLAFAISGIVLAFFTFELWPILRSGPNIKVEFSHFQNVRGGKVAIFQISNRGLKTVALYSANSMSPAYQLATYTGTNWDLTYSPSFTVTEFRFVLGPGAKIPVITFLPPVTNDWVVGVAYSESFFSTLTPNWLWPIESQEKHYGNQMGTSWSEPINRYSKPFNIVNPVTIDTNKITAR